LEHIYILHSKFTMNRIFIILFVVALAFIGCEKEREGIEMSIVETGCMNGWNDYYESTSDYKQAVKAYLNHNGITVYSVDKFNYYDGPVCMACSCATGNLIIIRIRETDITKAETLGFQVITNGQIVIPEEE